MNSGLQPVVTQTGLNEAVTVQLPVTCVGMVSYVNAAQLPQNAPSHLPVTCSAQSGKIVATMQGSISSAGTMFVAAQNTGMDPFLYTGTNTK